jgi:cytoskeletal protein CcmA (bactofilin family)
MFFGKKEKRQPEPLGAPMDKVKPQQNPASPAQPPKVAPLPVDPGPDLAAARAPRDETQSVPAQPTKRAGTFFEAATREPNAPSPSMIAPVGLDGTFIGKHVSIKGELVAKENLYIDGYFQGSLMTNGSKVTVGPNGRVNASINTTELVVFGVIEGNTEATEKILLKKNCSVTGDMTSPVIAIEEGVAVNGQLTCGTPRKADKTALDTKTNLKVVGENHG